MAKFSDSTDLADMPCAMPVEIPAWYRDALTAGAEVARRQVFFVVGCQKSGTTWLQHILDGHPQVRCSGEGHFGDVAGPLLEAAVNRYNDEERTTEPAPRADVFSVVRMFTDLALGRYLAGADDPSVVRALGDRTPEAALAMPALHTLYPTARFLHIIRDGRDAAVSGWAHLHRQGRGGQFESFAAYAAYFAERHWVPYIERARRAAKQMLAPYLEVRYEALHAEPMPTAWRMLEFLDVNVTPEIVRSCVEGATFERITRGRAPGEEDRSSHLRKGIVGDWRNAFDDEATVRFEEAGGELLRELGYAQALTSISADSGKGR